MLNREITQEATDMAAERALELVHVKACGLTRTPSVLGARCFMLLVDDYKFFCLARDRCFK